MTDDELRRSNFHHSTDELRRSSAGDGDGEDGVSVTDSSIDDSEWSASSIRSETSSASLLLDVHSHSSPNLTLLSRSATATTTAVTNTPSTRITSNNSSSSSIVKDNGRIGVGLRGDIYSLGCVVQLMVQVMLSF